MNKVYLDNGLKFKEVKACENFGNYTGDNEDEKCYLLNENEYVIADGDTEVFAPLEENESIAIAVKDDNRLVVRGDIEALNCFELLYETGYLEDSDIHIYSNNYFDVFQIIKHVLGIYNAIQNEKFPKVKKIRLVIGYWTIPDDLFDISQSPSPVCGINYYQDTFPEIYNNFFDLFHKLLLQQNIHHFLYYKTFCPHI